MALTANTAPAQGKHPAYLHALTDLRAARAHLERRGGGEELREEEKEAIHQIDEAISEIKKASMDDGKDLNDHPPVDAGLDHTGRLHRAKPLLEKAHQDIAREEDNAFAQGLQTHGQGRPRSRRCHPYRGVSLVITHRKRKGSGTSAPEPFLRRDS